MSTTLKDCNFCMLATDNYNETINHKSFNRVLYETNNFMVFPDRSQIGSMEGHLLVVPKLHYHSIGELPKEFHKELTELQIIVGNAIYFEYGIEPFYFEHGPASNAFPKGTCMDHMHMHVIPLEQDITDELSNASGSLVYEFSRNIAEIGNSKSLLFEAARLLCDNNISYYSYSHIASEPYQFKEELYLAPRLPESQLIRKIIAAKMGIPDKYGWAVFSELKGLESTIERLAGKFK